MSQWAHSHNRHHCAHLAHFSHLREISKPSHHRTYFVISTEMRAHIASNNATGWLHTRVQKERDTPLFELKYRLLASRICDDIYVYIKKIVCASRGERKRAQSWFFLFNPKRYIQMIGKANKDSIYCMLSVYINFFGAAAAVKLSWVFWPTTTTTTMTGRVSIWMISPQS